MRFQNLAKNYANLADARNWLIGSKALFLATSLWGSVDERRPTAHAYQQEALTYAMASCCATGC